MLPLLESESEAPLRGACDTSLFEQRCPLALSRRAAQAPVAARPPVTGRAARRRPPPETVLASFGSCARLGEVVTVRSVRRSLCLNQAPRRPLTTRPRG